MLYSVNTFLYNHVQLTLNIMLKQDNTTENRRGKTWMEDEENLIKLYYQQGEHFTTIASLIGRTEVAIKSRLAKPEPSAEQLGGR